MTNTKIMTDQFNIDIQLKTQMIDEQKAILIKNSNEILGLIKGRDEFRNDLKMVSTAKEKLEGRLFCDRNNARDI